MKPLDLGKLQEAIRARSVEWRRHVLQRMAGRSSCPLHVVAALDETTGQAFIVTVYEPSLEVFEADYKTKRKL